MDVDTDSIIALISFLVGSYIFVSKNIKLNIPERREILERLNKEKEAINKIKEKEAEAKAEGLMNKLFGIKKDIETDKKEMAKLQKEKEELARKAKKELEELQKKREEKEKKEKEDKEKKEKEEKDKDEKLREDEKRKYDERLREEEKRKEDEREKQERERRGKEEEERRKRQQELLDKHNQEIQKIKAQNKIERENIIRNMQEERKKKDEELNKLKNTIKYNNVNPNLRENITQQGNNLNIDQISKLIQAINSGNNNENIQTQLQNIKNENEKLRKQLEEKYKKAANNMPNVTAIPTINSNLKQALNEVPNNQNINNEQLKLILENNNNTLKNLKEISNNLLQKSDEDREKPESELQNIMKALTETLTKLSNSNNNKELLTGVKELLKNQDKVSVIAQPLKVVTAIPIRKPETSTQVIEKSKPTTGKLTFENLNNLQDAESIYDIFNRILNDLKDHITAAQKNLKLFPLNLEIDLKNKILEILNNLEINVDKRDQVLQYISKNQNEITELLKKMLVEISNIQPAQGTQITEYDINNIINRYIEDIINNTSVDEDDTTSIATSTTAASISTSAVQPNTTTIAPDPQPTANNQQTTSATVQQTPLPQTGEVKYKPPEGQGGIEFNKNLKTILQKGRNTNVKNVDVNNLEFFINSNESEGIIQVSNSIPELENLNNLSPLLILQSNESETEPGFFNKNLNNIYQPLFGVSKDGNYLPNPTKEDNIQQLLYLIKFDYVGLDSVKEQQASKTIKGASTVQPIEEIEDKDILDINQKKYKVNATYYNNLEKDKIKEYLKGSYSKAGGGYYNYNEHLNNSFNNQQLYGGQYAGQYYYPPRQIKQPLHNFIVPLMVFKMYRIILYKKLLKSEQKFVFQNILIDIVSSFMLIIGLFTLGLKKVASVLFTDLLSSVVVIYLFLFAYDDYVKDKSKVNVQCIINVLILIPYFVMYL